MKSIGLCVICSLAMLIEARAEGPKAGRPNVVVIITDDQGYGDLGVHGNPKIRTPNLDRLAGESVRLERFYVSPVCAPTRSSLMTGRYNYRTGVVDTFLGRAMMRPDEVTLAEMLGAAGYRTAIFGKWHLGDNYPLRPIDQGFQEALVHRGGGIGQPSDPPEPGRRQLLRPDPPAQRPPGEDERLLQRRLHRRRDQLHRRGPLPPVLRLPRVQLPPPPAPGARVVFEALLRRWTCRTTSSPRSAIRSPGPRPRTSRRRSTGWSPTSTTTSAACSRSSTSWGWPATRSSCS